MNDQNQDDAHREDDSNHHGNDPSAGGPPAHDVVQTTDPAVARGPGSDRQTAARPDETFVAETDRVTHAQPSYFADPQAFVTPGRSGADAQRSGSEKTNNDRAKDQSRRDQQPQDNEDADAAAQPGVMSYVLNGVIALVCGVGGALLFSYLDSSKSGDSAASSQKTGDSKQKKGDSSAKSDSGSGGTDGSEIPGFTSAEDAATLKGQIAHLSSRFDTLQQRIDSMSVPHDTAPPDISTLRNKIGEMSHSLGELSNVPSRLRQDETRLEQMLEDIRLLRDQMSAGGGGSTSSPPLNAVDRRVTEIAGPAPTPPPPASPVEANSPDFAMAEGIALFQRGKYAQADDIFRKLRLTKPGDARVWYYSALAHGLATGQWNGETRQLILQGADREKAGKPSTSQIDAAFIDLTNAQGKDWLAQSRNQLVKP